MIKNATLYRHIYINEPHLTGYKLQSYYDLNNENMVLKYGDNYYPITSGVLNHILDYCKKYDYKIIQVVDCIHYYPEDNPIVKL